MKYFFTSYLVIMFMAVFLFPQVASATTGNENVSDSPVSSTPEASPTPTCTTDACLPSQVPTDGVAASKSATVTTEPKVTITATTTPVPSVAQSATASAVPSITPDPTIMQMRQELNSAVSGQVDSVKKQIKNQEVALFHFFASIQDFFTSLF